MDDAVRAGQLIGHHSDPFDRMLIAQALARNIPLDFQRTASSTATASAGSGEGVPILSGYAGASTLQR